MTSIKTLCFALSLVALLAASVAAQTLYFYPPDDAKWIAGRSYISQGSEATAAALTIDPDRCGWYKATITSSSSLRNYAQFWLGKRGTDRIGPNGRMLTDFDEGVNFTAEGGVFRLGDMFSRLGNNIYFVADELDASDPNSGWYGMDPGIDDLSRCKFELAAFIYDTDPSVHPDFSCGLFDMNADEGNGPETKAACSEAPTTANLKGECLGVIRGLAKSTLNPTTRKIECGNCTKNGCWTNTDWFNKAFTSTSGVNVERCYNMPFTQVKTGTTVGSFEFDSDKMLNANGRLVGGFFPDILNTDAGLAQGDYSGCPNCKTKRSADRFPPRITAITREMFDEYQSKEGDFKNGDIPTRSAFGITANGTESIYDWVARSENTSTNPNWSAWYLHGSKSLKNTYGYATVYDTDAKANQHFCFESHAEFIYDPEQVFYFSGDDDIWVYINNKLVIDLGGAHFAAPDHVKLDTLGLTEGNTYPIDIFFCDRRTTMSSIRVSTNMYIVQKSNFTVNPSPARQEMCADISTGADCASKMNMSGTTGTKMCGEALIRGNYTVEFFMLVRGNTRDTIWLTPTATAQHSANPECTGSSANDFQCYKGIKVDNAVYSCGGRGQCKGNQEASNKVRIAGNYNVFVRLVNSSGQQMGKAIQIDNIKSEVNTRIVWGTLYNWEGKSTALKDAFGETTTREQTIIAGKRTPIHIASGAWESSSNFTKFAFDEEDAGGIGYSITVSGGTGLKIYENETGNTQKLSGTLPANGVETLWIEGGYDLGERDFYLNVGPEKDDAPSLKISLRQPTLRFVENSTSGASINSSGYARWSSDGKAPFVEAALDVYLVAWDPVHNTFCSHCEFWLGETSSTNNPGTNLFGDRIVQSDATRIIGGRANIYISGADVVNGSDYAKWKVYGPSEEFTFAEWTGLQFRIAPVLFPMVSYIYDRNGDGIGDSIRVEFNKSFFRDGAIVDSLLPILLEVEWEKGNVVSIYNKEVGTVEQLKDKNWVMNQYKNGWNNGFFSKNSSFWKPFVNDNLIVIAEPNTVFSKNILASGFNDNNGFVSSYTPFFDPDACQPGRPCPDAAFQYSSEGSRCTLISGYLNTPIITPATFAGNITAKAKGNAILLENLPIGAKIELYSLQGKRIYSTTSHSLLATSHLEIPIQTKGMYLVKISLGSEKTVLKVPLAGR